MDILGGLLVLGGIFLVIVIITAIFMSFIFSRIFSIIFAILAFILGLLIHLSGPPVDMTVFIFDVVISSFAWLFHRGRAVFDRWWDGSFSISISDREVTAEPKIVGGFLSNAIAAHLTFALIYAAVLSNATVFLCIIPVGIIVVDIISFFTGNITY